MRTRRTDESVVPAILGRGVVDVNFSVMQNSTKPEVKLTDETKKTEGLTEERVREIVREEMVKAMHPLQRFVELLAKSPLPPHAQGGDSLVQQAPHREAPSTE